MEAAELRALRHKWVAGAFPTTGESQMAAALIIDDLINECFALREELRQERAGGVGAFSCSHLTEETKEEA